jgi:hypothetical protein
MKKSLVLITGFSILIFAGFISCRKPKAERPATWKGLEGRWRPIKMVYDIKWAYLNYEYYYLKGNTLEWSIKTPYSKSVENLKTSWEINTNVVGDTLTVIENYSGLDSAGKIHSFGFGDRYVLKPGIYSYPLITNNMWYFRFVPTLDTMYLSYIHWGSSAGDRADRTLVKIK